MASKILRATQKLFASNAGPTQIGKFGSLAAGTPEYTSDPELIQSLSGYLDGWYGAILGGNSPAIQDVNALDFLWSRQLAYLMQQGIAEWDVETEYFENSYCTFAGVIYVSVADNNLAHSPDPATNTGAWWAPLGASPIQTFTVADSPVTILPAFQHVEFDCTGGNIVATLPTRAAFGIGRTLSVDRIDLTPFNKVTLNRASTDVIANLTLTDTSYELLVGLQSQDFFNGSAFWKVRG